MKNTLLAGLFSFLTPIYICAQPVFNQFAIDFKDKENSPYSIYKPYEFLSSQAIERRQRQGIAIDERDLPVNPQYVAVLREQGVAVHQTSKWLNSALVQANDAQIAQIRKLPFVKNVLAVGYYRRAALPPPKPVKRVFPKDYAPMNHYYGWGANQIELPQGEKLHQLGFRGKGMLVAVLDGGFQSADELPFYEKLRRENRLLQGRDFADGDHYVFESSNHGQQVLSTMASEIPNLFVGTAPDASFVCIKTEDVTGESRIEEEYWAAGAEFADSLGVDVINSSLGYNTFDVPSMNYTHEQLDGQTSRASRAASIAYEKGILVFNSAGNSGGSAWEKIGVPADAEGAIAVASVNFQGEKSNFSSTGLAADGRIKPDLAVPGEDVTVTAGSGYHIGYGSGTSFASPILTGIATSLWQAFPEKNNRQVREALEKSANQLLQPDAALGYGIPNALRAFEILTENKRASNKAFTCFIDVWSERVELLYYNPLELPSYLILQNSLTGEQHIMSLPNKKTLQKIELDWQWFENEITHLQLVVGNTSYIAKIGKRA